jgi:hypothetical protein
MWPFWRLEFWGGSYICGNVVGHRASQEISRILRNSEAYYRVHKSPPFVRILSRISPGHSFASWCFKIYVMLSSHLRVGLPRGVCPSAFSTKTVSMSLLPHTFYVPHSPLSLFDYPNNIWRGVHFMMLITQRSWMTCHHFNKTGLIIPHVVCSKLDRGVQGRGGRSGTCCDVGITELSCGLVPPTTWSEGVR